MRANFNIWRDNPKDFISADNIFYAMFEEVDGKRVACELTNFPRGTALMNELMEKVNDMRPVQYILISYIIYQLGDGRS